MTQAIAPLVKKSTRLSITVLSGLFPYCAAKTLTEEVA